jgi:IS4 transposase
VFDQILVRCSGLAASKGRRFRFKNPLYSMDASTIELCLKVFDWAHFRRAKGAVKLHLLLNHQGYLPCWAMITDGKTHEVNTARLLELPAGAIVAMDRGYNDYRLFSTWTKAKVYFVTRLKDSAVYEVLERREVDGKKILADEIIRFSGVGAEEKCPHSMRRVVVWDEEHEREIVLLTNIMHFAASTVAAIYKERWQIELFFKALKQNLKVKTFVGTSENAVRIQLWTALITILLLKFMQMKSSFNWSLSNLSAMFRMVLLTHRDLWLWLDEPFGSADPPPAMVQLELFA